MKQHLLCEIYVNDTHTCIIMPQGTAATGAGDKPFGSSLTFVSGYPLVRWLA